jgi:hypothetical protein
MMDTTGNHQSIGKPPIILIGIFLAACYWIAEAYFDSLLIENTSFQLRLFPADMNELWMRSFIALLLVGFGVYLQLVHRRMRKLEAMNVDAAWLLKNALSKTIRGYFPICVFCRKIQDEDGLWVSPDRFIAAQTDAEFGGSLCGECQENHARDGRIRRQQD